RVNVAHDDGRAIDEHLTGVWLFDPPGDLHQRGFAGAVFPEERDDLSRVHVEGDTLQCMHAEEALLDVSKLENRHAHDGTNGPRPRPRSSVSFFRNSSTSFCRNTLVGMNTWWLGGIPDRSPASTFAMSVIAW